MEKQKQVHITEWADIPKKEKIKESVFKGLHLGDKFINMYLDDRDKLTPEQLKDIEDHFKIPCDRCVEKEKEARLKHSLLF